MPQGAKFYFFAPSGVAKNRRNLIKNLESLRGLQNNLSRPRLLVLIRDSKFVLFKKPRHCFFCSRRVKISLSEPAEFLSGWRSFAARRVAKDRLRRNFPLDLKLCRQKIQIVKVLEPAVCHYQINQRVKLFGNDRFARINPDFRAGKIK